MEEESPNKPEPYKMKWYGGKVDPNFGTNLITKAEKIEDVVWEEQFTAVPDTIFKTCYKTFHIEVWQEKDYQSGKEVWNYNVDEEEDYMGMCINDKNFSTKEKAQEAALMIVDFFDECYLPYISKRTEMCIITVVPKS